VRCSISGVILDSYLQTLARSAAARPARPVVTAALPLPAGVWWTNFGFGPDPMTIQKCLEATDKELAHPHHLDRLRILLAELLNENSGRAVQQSNRVEALSPGLQTTSEHLYAPLGKLIRVDSRSQD
jgi:hypothetical protein